MIDKYINGLNAWGGLFHNTVKSSSLSLPVRWRKWQGPSSKPSTRLSCASLDLIRGMQKRTPCSLLRVSSTQLRVRVVLPCNFNLAFVYLWSTYFQILKTEYDMYVHALVCCATFNSVKEKMYFLRKKPFDLRGPSNFLFVCFGWGQMPFPLWVSLRKWRSASMIKRGTAGVSHTPPLVHWPSICPGVSGAKTH